MEAVMPLNQQTNPVMDGTLKIAVPIIMKHLTGNLILATNGLRAHGHNTGNRGSPKNAIGKRSQWKDVWLQRRGTGRRAGWRRIRRQIRGQIQRRSWRRHMRTSL